MTDNEVSCVHKGLHLSGKSLKRQFSDRQARNSCLFGDIANYFEPATLPHTKIANATFRKQLSEAASFRRQLSEISESCQLSETSFRNF
jgi:hypothetical protein